MATLAKRGNRYRVIFRFQGKRHAAALDADDGEMAQLMRAEVELVLLKLRKRHLELPAGANVVEFVLAGGKLPISGGSQSEPEPYAPVAIATKVTEVAGGPPKELTLGALRDRYVRALGVGAVEANTVRTIRIHFRHWVASVGEDFPVSALKQEHLQALIDRRRSQPGRRGEPVSAATLMKELATLRCGWNRAGGRAAAGDFPDGDLVLPKRRKKAKFRTRTQIEREIALGGLSEAQSAELWDSLFLTREEVDEVLEHIRKTAIQPWVYPMAAFAAFTGARRSEMIRARRADLDLDAGTAEIHEMKKAKGEATSRRVPLPAPLIAVLRDWLAVHPGGPWLFCQPGHVPFSRKRRPGPTRLTPHEAHNHLRRALDGGRWAVVRGWHTFRHTFVSLCASRGVDPRTLRSWVGHLTEEMQQRYTHLYPSDEQQVIATVFGTG